MRRAILIRELIVSLVAALVFAGLAYGSDNFEITGTATYQAPGVVNYLSEDLATLAKADALEQARKQCNSDLANRTSAWDVTSKSQHPAYAAVLNVYAHATFECW